MSTKIWLTNEKLNLLPKAHTTLQGKGADEQIAIRYEEDVVISLPEFNKVEKPYLLLHESLHGILGGEGSIKHLYVRTATKYLKENRGFYSKSSIEEMLSKVESNYKDTVGYLDDMDTDSLVKLLFSEEGSFEARCGIATAIHLEFNWGNYSKCNKNENAIFDLFDKKYPILRKFRKTPFADILETYKVNPSATFFHNRFLRDIEKEQCEKYSSVYELKRNKDVSTLLNQAEAALVSIQELNPKILDNATFQYLNLIVKFNPSHDFGPLGGYLDFSKFSRYKEIQDESWANFNDNISKCRKLKFIQ